MSVIQIFVGQMFSSGLKILNQGRREILIPSCLSRQHYSTKAAKSQDPDAVREMPVIDYVPETGKRQRRLYSWGFVPYGALGNPEFVKPKRKNRGVVEIKKPRRLKFAEEHKVYDVACGNNFTVIAALSQDRGYSVFGVGLNTDSQIGYHAFKTGEPVTILTSPVPISLPLIHGGTRAIRVACGRAHTMILTNKEGVFSLGNNCFGQCGRPIVEREIYENSLKINKVCDLPENIADVVCGQDHSLFLTSTGEVYSCGWGADGQTGKAISGQGHYDNCGIPRQVKGDIVGEKIVHLAGAVDCILAVSDKGDLFGWGNSEYNQFGSITREPQINISRHIPVPHVGKVKYASAGGSTCALVNEKGHVYVWGFGLLGQGPNVSHLPSPSLLPEPLFGKNDFNPDVCVLSVTCGLRHFAAINNKGHLYMWGKNRNSCLGLDSTSDQFFPFRVSIPSEVCKVTLGAEHTFALCLGGYESRPMYRKPIK